jgi:hypothetical protein
MDQRLLIITTIYIIIFLYYFLVYSGKIECNYYYNWLIIFLLSLNFCFCYYLLGSYLNDYGLEYEENNNYEKAKKYYEWSIWFGNKHAMYNLGEYYEDIEKNYDLMKKYYLMAIEEDDVDAMYNLGKYYENVEINYDEMKKYYLMAINNGNFASTNSLLNYIIDNEIYDNDIEKIYNTIKKNKKFKNSISIKNNLKTIKKKMFFAKIKHGIFDENDNIKKNKIFRRMEILDRKCKCMICFSKDEKYYIDLRCPKNKNDPKQKFSHAFCGDCFVNWFSKKDMKCLNCYKDFQLNNCVFVENSANATK